MAELGKGQEDTGPKVVEATEFKFVVRSDPGFKKPDSTLSIRH